MKIDILPLIEGAKAAKGLAVVIDVFRAFSLECYMFEQGIDCVIPVESLEMAKTLKMENPEYVLFGERQGIIQEGFEYGNSPYHIQGIDLTGKTAVHASSSGTRGLHAAVNSEAESVITGSYVNAKAIANYIKKEDPDFVSLIPMGWAGEYMTKEDLFCAEYIKALLTGNPDPNPDYLFELYETDGRRFFNRDTQRSMPITDFYLCLKKDIFNFVLKAEKGTDPVKLSKLDI